MAKQKNNGFTLLEVLLAFLLLTILTASVAKFYSQGKIIYKKLSKKEKNDFQLKELEYDLKRLVEYNNIHFTMNADKIYFLMAVNNSFYYTEYIKEKEYDKTIIRKREVLYPVDFETIDENKTIDLLKSDDNISWEVLNPLRKKVETIDLGEEEEIIKFLPFKKWRYKETPSIFKITIGKDIFHYWIGQNKYNFVKDNYFIVEEKENEEK